MRSICRIIRQELRIEEFSSHLRCKRSYAEGIFSTLFDSVFLITLNEGLHEIGGLGTVTYVF